MCGNAEKMWNERHNQDQITQKRTIGRNKGEILGYRSEISNENDDKIRRVIYMVTFLLSCLIKCFLL